MYKELFQHLSPTLAFIDLDMPLIDGLEVSDWFAEQGKFTFDNCAFFIVTRSVNPNDVDRASKNNLLRQLINKPLTQKKLESISKIVETWI